MTYTELASRTYDSPQKSSRGRTTIDTFLIHHQASTNSEATLRMMLTGSREVSSNYIITGAGEIWGVVPEEFRAWTSGSSTDGGKGAAWDSRSITVEIENETGGPGWRISDAAVDAAARLLADLRTRYQIVNVLGHKDLWEQHHASYPTYCPGPETVARVIAAEPKPFTPPPESELNMLYLMIIDGLGRYGAKGVTYFATYDGRAFVSLTAEDANAVAVANLAGRSFANVTYSAWDAYKKASEILA